MHLKHLEVKSNYLKYLPYNIGSMTALKVGLFFSFLELQSKYNTWAKMKGSKFIDQHIFFNSVSVFRKAVLSSFFTEISLLAFFIFTVWQVLRIPGNEITELPQSISVLTNLVRYRSNAQQRIWGIFPSRSFFFFFPFSPRVGVPYLFHWYLSN